jgi:quinol monooxygenase YgiN
VSRPAVIAKITAQPGKRDELVAGLQAALDNAETEPGTLAYVLHTDNADPDTVWFYERYDSQEALDAHRTSDAMKAVGLALRDVAAGRPEITVVTPVGGKGF